MRHTTAVWGGLNCHVLDDLPDRATPQSAVVLLHGFGAPGTDLVGLAEALGEIVPALAATTTFVFPEAPLSLEELGLPGGRAWWPLNLARLQSQLASGRFEDVRREKPPGLHATRAAVHEVLIQLSEVTGVAPGRIVLGGFSQGAMVAMDAATSTDQPLGGLALLSGAVVNEDEWRAGARFRTTLPVFQSHGQWDEVLPYITAEWLREIWTSVGNAPTFVRFNGGHGIPWDVLTRLAAWLQERFPPI